MELSTLLILFFIGIFIGSFLNVIALRYRPGGRLLQHHVLGGRSACRTCSTQLRWYELVPLFSFFVQGTKCRHCSHALSWQYPIVEFVAGLLTAALPATLYGFFNVAQLLARGESIFWFYGVVGIWLLATYIFVVIAVIDLRYRIIPDQASGLLAILGLGLLVLKSNFSALFAYNGSFFKSYATIFGGQGGPFVNALLAVLLGVVLFGGIVLFTKGRGMGLGDLKLAIPIALLLGWPDVILAFASAFIVGSLCAIPLLLHKVKKMSDGIPFGPFMIIGVYIAIFYGVQISQWYFSLI
ncbi:MAG: hypothetical protein COU11_00705 [Candidatus Harrisonbacteria bacterium CG10_big_fil_rev_8_21_14_0_10_49_15]|uniref:Prepilin peptidase n=1 Tax=Candidatus Harrisonbacteria bacterium CG10_big_fil_rev_8_21_14_0_10_49_15 TaxID=1974587 RepID=A0A2H0ULX7_9BACT|nr:MAG: hypothetical protein COU11_00705 [Candidatus Harrisonbacteria bacterium CG10_big_fil_rev_8_21_14_0_10_49_15]